METVESNEFKIGGRIKSHAALREELEIATSRLAILEPLCTSLTRLLRLYRAGHPKGAEKYQRKIRDLTRELEGLRA